MGGCGAGCEKKDRFNPYEGYQPKNFGDREAGFAPLRKPWNLIGRLSGIALLLLTGCIGDEEQNRQRALTAKAAFAVDRVLVEKGARRLTLLHRGKIVRRYTIQLGFDPVGHKQREGDGRTPIGRYRIDARNPRSSFHLSIRISYPDARDKARAKAAGVSPGGDIFIHGEPNGTGWLQRWLRIIGLEDRGDWTHGCIAVTNSQMREIWANVKTGTPIEIRP